MGKKPPIWRGDISRPIPLPIPLQEHWEGLEKVAMNLATSDGRKIEVWNLRVSDDPEQLKRWAAHFRQHYCHDAEIDTLRQGTGLTRTAFLLQILFPDEAVAPGPSIRAGDFAEILVSDYVEHILGYWVPRGKYADKSSRNESIKGVDILGFKMKSNKPGELDELVEYEVKAQLSGSSYTGCLQKAINDSAKDHLRRAMTLNATKRRLQEAGDKDRALFVERFQNMADRPYVWRAGAVALLSDAAYKEKKIGNATDASAHPTVEKLDLVVIRGSDLMKLTHLLYQRAADEA